MVSPSSFSQFTITDPSSEDILRLTDIAFNTSGYALFANSVSINLGLSVTFDFYAYGGTGADGFSFFFIDGSKSPTKPGGSGGSLGYAPRGSEPGLEGAYLGVGFDEFGNFSRPTEGRVGGLAVRVPDTIALRGSQQNSYAYLTGTTTLPSSLDNPGPTATRENSRRRAKIDLSPDGLISVKVDLNDDGDFLDAGENAIDSFNVTGVNGVLPSTFKFGLGAATGGMNNIHEIGNFKVTAFNGSPLSTSFKNDLNLTGLDQTRLDQKDVLTGLNGADTLTGGAGSDVLIGRGGADRFVFSGSSKEAALKNSTLRSMDVIADFNQSQGDRFVLDFDRNLTTVQLPNRLYNAGRKGTARNILKATKNAYADKLKKKGKQALSADEAVFFRAGSRTFLSVNDSKAPFSPKDDLLVEVTGIQFRPNERLGALSVRNYFV